MYNPAHFKEENPQALRELIAQQPLATLITLGSDGLHATHLPLLYDSRAVGFGVLRGHMAKANPQWSDLKPEVPALAIFTGPQHYIQPELVSLKSGAWQGGADLELRGSPRARTYTGDSRCRMAEAERG